MMPLRRNRLLLIASLLLLGGALGLTLGLLEPDGTILAPDVMAGATGDDAGLRGYGADRFGGTCGIEGDVGDERLRVPLPECTSYQAPEIVRFEGRDVAVWELADDSIAVGTLDGRLHVEEVRTVPRPRASYGALLPRTSVEVDGERLFIRYRGSLLLVLGQDLEPWPGGPVEVAAARLGTRGPALLGGVFGLFLLCLLGAGWTLLLPWQLAREHAAGRTLEARLAERGTSVLVDGQPLELELSSAQIMSGRLTQLGGRIVTLVLDRHAAPGASYRELARASVRQLWAGDLHEAALAARGLRTGAAAMAIASLAALLLALDAYVVL